MSCAADQRRGADLRRAAEAFFTLLLVLTVIVVGGCSAHVRLDRGPGELGREGIG